MRAMPLSEPVRAQIESLVTGKPVVLFMKGNRQFPQCGFSAQVIQILDEVAGTYETVNVLADPEVRDGIKEYSSWPTIPQLYVKGQFVGGCDIVKEMYASGELQRLLGTETAPVTGSGACPAWIARVSNRVCPGSPFTHASLTFPVSPPVECAVARRSRADHCV